MPRLEVPHGQLWIKNIYAKQSKAGIFCRKIEMKALKFFIDVLNCTLGPPNLGANPPPPESARESMSSYIFKLRDHQM